MTALATAPTAGPRPARTWHAVLRLHRVALIIWAVIFAALSGVLLWAYGPGASAARADWRLKCGSHGCGWSSAISSYHLAHAGVEVTIGAIPYVAAVWAGAVLVGRELESGTAHLSWTQGISPTRWLATTLAVPAALITAGSTVLVLVHRLLFDAHKVPVTWNWWDDATFTANGPLAVALPLLGLAVGALAGLLLRRALVAGGLAFVATALVATVLSTARTDLWPSVTRTGTARFSPPDTAWQLTNGVIVHGKRVANPEYGHCDGTGTQAKQCLADHGITGYYSVYHPDSHFWPLQLVETGIVLAVTAAATAAAFRLLRRRTA
ncbi:hypothetical protein [Streptomyces mirabilis]|uniref:hypothetical protein n=1 Tax=Streptomyces mirabilis TaxID=68239 RepID=UPI00369C97A3